MTGHSLGGGIALVVGALTDRLAVALQPPGGNIPGFFLGVLEGEASKNAVFFKGKTKFGDSKNSAFFFVVKNVGEDWRSIGIFRFHTHPNDDYFSTGDGELHGRGVEKCQWFSSHA